MVYFLVRSFNLSADHLNGGIISYECLGETFLGSDTLNFKITVDLFGSCFATGICIPTSNSLWIGVESTDSIYSFGRFRDSIDYLGEVPVPKYSCLIFPPNLCVDQGRFVYYVTLPVINDDYIIVSHDCCLNQNIVNILNPEDNGFLISSKITSQTQQLKTSSPLFSSDLPYVVCSKEYIEVPLFFTSSSNDLVYSFCPVNDIDFQGIISIPYNLPNYTPLHPLGNPGLSIDSGTGIISGTPQFVGQYLVGVCISEYQNGQLLSETTFVFQLSVSECEEVLQPDFGDDVVWVNDHEFELTICDEDQQSILIDNRMDTSFVDSFYWEIQNYNGSWSIYQEWQPYIDLPVPGIYQANLLVNPGTQCADSLHLLIRKSEQRQANFSFTYDTCNAGPVRFLNESTGSMGTYLWDFDDGQFSSQSDPFYQYPQPGRYDVQLSYTDAFGCVDSTSKSIRWQPAPAIIIVEPEAATGCAPLQVGFRNLSNPIDSNYLVEWDFFPPAAFPVSGLEPLVTFEEATIYEVAVKVTSPIGCTTEAFFSNIIEVFKPPVANFYWTPEEPNNLQDQLFIYDKSEGGEDWYYHAPFGESLSANPVFSMPAPGNYSMSLEIFSKEGCQDSIQKTITIERSNTYFLPNAFSPNGDGQNDVFVGVGAMEGITNFHLTILDRWGQLVFESNQPDYGWNGSKYNHGKILPNGVYHFQYSFQTANAIPVKNKGFITLIK